MKVRDVLIKYSEIVPFPWSAKKILKAGFDPNLFIIEVGKDLVQCEDSNDPSFAIILRNIKDLEKELENP